MSLPTEIPIQDNAEPVQDLHGLGFVLSPAYFQQGLTSSSSMYLRQEAAQKLCAIQKELTPFRFKIWDGLRSVQVQSKLYQWICNELREQNPDLNDEDLKACAITYVADPHDKAFLPPHTTGGAVDLTLVDEDGLELSMGTEIDECVPQSHVLYFEENRINEEARRNRRLLRKAMLQAGFAPCEDEWWHYEYGTQLWAAFYGKSQSFYGKITAPEELSYTIEPVKEVLET